MYYFKRILAFIIDWYIVFFVSIPMFFIGGNLTSEFFLRPTLTAFSPYGFLLGLAAFAVLPLIKDLVFKNASIGKKICGLKIVGEKDGAAPKFLSLIIRNLAFYLTFPNAIVFAVTKKSLGDYIGGTRVVSAKKQ